MPYIGKQPTKIPLTSADIADGSISNVDIADLDAAKLTGTVNNARISLDAAEIPNLDAAKITSGDIALARLGNAPATDLTPVRQDIAMLALYNAVSDNRAAYNLPFSFIDQFEDDTGLTTQTDVDRITSGEYVGSMYSISGAFADDSDTAFLLHSNTTDGSTTFTDSSSNARPILAQGTSPTHSTAQSKLGSSSIIFSGSNGLTVASHASHVFSGDFTMEYWIYTPAGGSNSRVLVLETGSADQIYTRHRTDSGSYGLAQVLLTGEANSAGEAFYSHNLTPEQSAIGAWVHIALVRQGAVIRGYIGGVQKVTWTKAAIGETPDGTISIGFCAGCGPGEYLQANSYLDELRISGVCRYLDGTTFTPAEDIIGSSATGTLISDTQTSSVATTKMSGVILYKDGVGTATTLGTHLIISFSANGGSNWTDLTSASDYDTLTPVFSTGVKMVKLKEKTVTSGTTPVIKAVWATQESGVRETQLHGWAMNY